MHKWRILMARLPMLRQRRFYIMAAAGVFAVAAIWLLAASGGDGPLTETDAAAAAEAAFTNGAADELALSQAADEEPVLTLPDEVEAYVIRVNGQAVVGLPTKADAEAVLAELQEQYTAQWQGDGEQVEAFGFREKVEVAKGAIAFDRVRPRDEAKRILLRGTDRILNYTVQRGDTMWGIAEEQGMDLEDLEKANPGVDPEALQIGQELNLIVAEPYVHTTATVRHTYVANIQFATEEREAPDLYPWESTYEKRGVYGRQRVTEILDFEGNQIIGRRVVEVERLSDPEKAIYLRGTKTAPMLGSGQFIVPVQGATFTSGFGPRWGSHHNGIDLAAPHGTPVYAADSGTVIAAGWLGGLGYAVKIDHGAGKYVTVYGHFSSYVVNVGDEVTQGQLIGRVGDTGYSFGAHLHFEIHVDGQARDPLQYFPN